MQILYFGPKVHRLPSFMLVPALSASRSASRSRFNSRSEEVGTFISHLGSLNGRQDLESQPTERIPVSIPADLYAQIKKSIEGKGFSTVDDFVTYVLRVTMGKQPDKPEDVEDSGVVDQLKALGYI